MAKRPLLVTIVASLFLLIPPAVVVFLVMTSQGQVQMAASTITLNLLLITLGTTIVGLGLWRVKPWGFFSLFIFSAGIIGYNMYRFFTDSSTLSHWDIALLVGVTFAMGLSLRRQISAPYFNPRMRWWERADRINVDLKGQFQIDGNWKDAAILDISRTGVFAKLDSSLQAGDLIQMKLQVADYELNVPTRVIRIIGDRGVGLMYTDLTFGDRREIKKILKYLTQTKKGDSQELPA